MISRLILDPFHVFTWLDFTADKKCRFFTAGNKLCSVSFFVAGVKYPALVELRGSAPKCPLKPRVAPGWRQFYQQVGQLFLPNVWGGRQWASVRKIHYAVFEIQIKIQNWAAMLLQRNEGMVNLQKVEYFPPMFVKCKTPEHQFPPEAGNKRWDNLTCNGWHWPQQWQSPMTILPLVYLANVRRYKWWFQFDIGSREALGASLLPMSEGTDGFERAAAWRINRKEEGVADMSTGEKFGSCPPLRTISSLNGTNIKNCVQ